MNIDRIKIKNITSTIRENSGYTPAVGELVFETDTGKLYVGNGTTKISNLNTIPAIPQTVDTSIKFSLDFKNTPPYNQNNILLKDNAGNFDFRWVKTPDYNSEIIKESLSNTGLYCVRSDWNIFLNAQAKNNLLNIEPSKNYLFEMLVYPNTTQNTDWFYRINNKSYFTITDNGGATNAQEYAQAYNTICEALNCKPASIHSMEELDFLGSYLRDGWKMTVGSKSYYFLALGGTYDYSTDNITWLDGSNVDFQRWGSGDVKAENYFYLQTSNYPPADGWGADDHDKIQKYKVCYFDYVKYPDEFFNLKGQLILRLQNNKLKLEIPNWNIDTAGIHDLNTKAWNLLTLKISNGKICAYCDGKEDISENIPANASTLTPDLISAGSFNGYIDKFFFQSLDNLSEVN